MRYLIITLFMCLPLHADSPSADDFKKELAKLDSKSSKEQRISALRYIGAKAESEHASLAIAPLEKLIRSKDEEAVRQAAIAARHQIAKARNEPCPIVFIEVLTDETEFVRYEASMWASMYKGRQAEGSMKILLEAVKDKRDGVRSDCLYHLADAGGKEALLAIENAKKDKVFEVRHTAYVTHFRLTNKLDEFLDYMIRLREDPKPLLDSFLEDSEQDKLQKTQRNLSVLGSTVLIWKWSEERPEELAKALVKLLDHKSAFMRRGAADMIGAAARKVVLPESKFSSPFSPLLPYIESGDYRKFFGESFLLSPPKKEEPLAVLPSKAYLHFRNFKAFRLLAYLSTMDPDLTVRASASLALKRIEELPEPLTIAPRQVKP